MAAILTGRKAEMSGNRKSVKRTGAVGGGGVIPEGRVRGGPADAPGGVVLESGLSLTRSPDRSAERKLYPILAKPPSSPVSWEGRSERVASLVNVPFRHPDLGAFRLLPPGARARRVGSARSPPRTRAGAAPAASPGFIGWGGAGLWRTAVQPRQETRHRGHAAQKPTRGAARPEMPLIPG